MKKLRDKLHTGWGAAVTGLSDESTVPPRKLPAMYY